MSVSSFHEKGLPLNCYPEPSLRHGGRGSSALLLRSGQDRRLGAPLRVPPSLVLSADATTVDQDFRFSCAEQEGRVDVSRCPPALLLCATSQGNGPSLRQATVLWDLPSPSTEHRLSSVSSLSTGGLCPPSATWTYTAWSHHRGDNSARGTGCSSQKHPKSHISQN